MSLGALEPWSLRPNNSDHVVALNVVHLLVGSRHGQARLEDEVDAGRKEQARADEAEEEGDPADVEVEERNDSDGHTRGDEEADGEVEAGHGPLEKPRAARVDLELLVEMLPPPVRSFVHSLAEGLQFLGALANAIHTSNGTARRRD